MEAGRERQLSSTARKKDYELEILKYLEEPVVDQTEDPLVYWKMRFPVLSSIAETALGLPASSAAAERTFSIAGKVFKPDRCRLSDKNVEKLSCNKHIQ